VKKIGDVIPTIKQPDGGLLIRLSTGWHKVHDFCVYVRRGGRFRRWIKMARARIGKTVVEVCLGVASVVDLVRAAAKSGVSVPVLGLRTLDNRQVSYTASGLMPR